MKDNIFNLFLTGLLVVIAVSLILIAGNMYFYIKLFPSMICADGSPKIEKMMRSNRDGRYHVDWFCPYANLHFSDQAWMGTVELKYISNRTPQGGH